MPPTVSDPDVLPVPELSIVIVNWNVRELLRDCLQSVLQQGGLPPAQLQLIVVDNASADGSVEMLRAEFPGVTLVANTGNLGFGCANNQGLALARGRLLLLLNPDTRVLPGALAALVAHLDARPDVALLGCRLLNVDGSLQRWTGGAFPRLANLATHHFFLDRLLPPRWRPQPLYLDRDVAQDIEVDWVSGAVMLMRREPLGGRLFNPDYFMYGEDMELCHRLKAEGGRIVYTPAVSIIHVQGASMKQQQAEVMLSSLKGPRQFYKHVRGGRGLRAYDLMTWSGFVLRSSLYALAWCLLAPLGRGAVPRARLRNAADLMQRSWRILRAG